MNASLPMKTLMTVMFLAVAAAAQANASGPRAAVVRLVPASFERTDASMTAVNDCATQLMARDLELARPACNRAIAIVNRARSPHLRDSLALAAAFSNRALLGLMSGDLPQAEADMARAIKLAPEQAFIARNRLAIEYALAIRRIAQH